MIRCSTISLLCILSAISFAEDDPFASHVRTTAHLSPVEEKATFQLPEGFDITLFASEPDIAKPLNMAFDKRGRLWLTNTVEYPYPAKGEGRDTLKILEDTDDDGHADKITTFADGLNVPIGITPYGDGAICFTIPNIVYLRDTDGDGICDKREKLYGPFDYSRDTHGMVNSFLLQPDGWIYACHGFNNNSKVAGTDGHEVEMNSGNIFRFRPDGSRIEVFTRGQVNPFGLAVNEYGDYFTADCHTKPISLLVPGGYHESFGKPHDGLGFIPRIMEHIHGSTAICGIAFGSATRFPKQYRDSVFSGNVTTCRINQNKLVYTESSPHAIEQPDFLTTTDPWFRPIDLKINPQGDLFVADFYNAVIGHYEVPLDHPKRDRTSGRIWRIRYDGSEETNQSSKRTNAAIERRAAVLTASQNPAESQIANLIQVLADCPENDPQLRYATRLALRNHLLNEQWFETLINTPLPENTVRDIAEICLAIKTPAAAQYLLRYIDKVSDIPEAQLSDLLQFAVQYAPVDTLDSIADLAQKRFPENTTFQKDLLLALHKGLTFRGKSAPPAMNQWAESLARTLLAADTSNFASTWTSETKIWSIANARWNSLPLGEEFTGAMRSSAFQPGPEFQFLISGHDGHPNAEQKHKNKVHLRHSVTDEILFTAEAPRNDVPQLIQWDTSAIATTPVYLQLVDDINDGAYAWLAAGQFSIASLNPSPISDQRKIAAELITALNLTALRADAGQALKNESAPLDLARAIATLSNSPLLSAVAETTLTPAAIDCLTNADEASAAGILQTAMRNSSADQQSAVTNQLVNNPAGIDLLLDLIESGTCAGAELRRPFISRTIETIGSDPQKARIQAILTNLPPESETITEIIATRIASIRQTPGDPAAGQLIFQQQCTACHQVAGQGNNLAPNLDGIGNRGLERLVEDILDPNRNVDIAFRITTIVKTDGTAITGFIRREEAQQLILADPSGKEIAIPNNQISEKHPSPLSLMPPTFAQTLTPPHFNDLITWLLALR
jgi:putative heme-binding domain-containing protein